MNLTQLLKSELWKRYGSKEHPAEWDGRVYGGGKLSQRFWEYFKTIELLDLKTDSVVLDLGGGSPSSGAGFFANLLATRIQRVIVLDPNAGQMVPALNNIELVRAPASQEEITKLLKAHPELTHIASVSVFEHMEPELREGVVRGINDSFAGNCFATTFEFHPKTVHFEHQLTAKSVSSLFEPFTNFYLDQFTASPVLGETAYESQYALRCSRKGPIGKGEIPRWYPVAVRFLRG